MNDTPHILLDFEYVTRDSIDGRDTLHLIAEVETFTQRFTEFNGWNPEIDLVFVSEEAMAKFVTAIYDGEKDEKNDLNGRIKFAARLHAVGENIARISYDPENVSFTAKIAQ